MFRYIQSSELLFKLRIRARFITDSKLSLSSAVPSANLETVLPKSPIKRTETTNNSGAPSARLSPAKEDHDLINNGFDKFIQKALSTIPLPKPNKPSRAMSRKERKQQQKEQQALKFLAEATQESSDNSVQWGALMQSLNACIDLYKSSEPEKILQIDRTFEQEEETEEAIPAIKKAKASQKNSSTLSTIYLTNPSLDALFQKTAAPLKYKVKGKKAFTIVGDLYNNFDNLQQIFQLSEFPSTTSSYLFLGNIIEKSSKILFSVFDQETNREIICIRKDELKVLLSIIKFKLENPSSIYILKGENELLLQNTLQRIINQINLEHVEAMKRKIYEEEPPQPKLRRSPRQDQLSAGNNTKRTIPHNQSMSSSATAAEEAAPVNHKKQKNLEEFKKTMNSKKKLSNLFIQSPITLEDRKSGRRILELQDYELCLTILTFLKNLPLAAVVDQKYFFVHSGIGPLSSEMSLKEMRQFFNPKCSYMHRYTAQHLRLMEEFILGAPQIPWERIEQMKNERLLRLKLRQEQDRAEGKDISSILNAKKQQKTSSSSSSASSASSSSSSSSKKRAEAGPTILTVTSSEFKKIDNILEEFEETSSSSSSNYIKEQPTGQESVEEILNERTKSFLDYLLLATKRFKRIKDTSREVHRILFDEASLVNFLEKNRLQFLVTSNIVTNYASPDLRDATKDYQTYFSNQLIHICSAPHEMPNDSRPSSPDQYHQHPFLNQQKYKRSGAILHFPALDRFKEKKLKQLQQQTIKLKQEVEMMKFKSNSFSFTTKSSSQLKLQQYTEEMSVLNRPFEKDLPFQVIRFKDATRPPPLPRHHRCHSVRVDST